MIIRFEKPGPEGFTVDQSGMSGVPRVGDSITFDYGAGGMVSEHYQGYFEVRAVQWCPNEDDFQVYVVLR